MRLLTYLTPGLPGSLFEVLGGVLGAEVVYDTSRSGPDEADDPFRDGRADLGWVCSTSYAALRRSADPSVRLVGVGWVPADPDAAGRPVYFADLVVRPGSAARSLEDLAGARIGGNDAISLSGHHALRIELARRGLDPDEFASVEFTGGHQRSLDLVIDGMLDAAVVDSVTRTARARRDPAVAGLRLVERLGPWPTQPLVAARALDAAAVERAGTTLLAANEDPTVQAELVAAALSALVPIAADHCDPVVDAMAGL